MEPSLDELRERFASDATDHLVYGALRRAYENAGDGKHLADLIERWADKRSDPREAARAFAEAGEAREKLGELDKASRHYARALELDARQVIAVRGFMRIATELRDIHRQIEFLEPWSKRLVEAGAGNAELAEAEITLARAWSSLTGKLDKALEHYRRAVEIDPEVEAILDEAVDKAKKARRTTEVRSLLATGAATTKDATRKVALLRALADARKEMPSDVDGAIEALTAARLIAPDDRALATDIIDLRKARAQRKKGTPDAAADLAAIAELYVELARWSTPDGALDDVERALDLAPTHPVALAMLQSIGQRRAIPERVTPRLEAFIKATPDPAASADARRKLATLHANAGKLDAAFDVIAPLLASAPSIEVAREGLTHALDAGRLVDAIRLIPIVYAGWSADHVVKAQSDVLRRALERRDDDAATRAANAILLLDAHSTEALVALTDLAAKRKAYAEQASVLERRLGIAATPSDKKALLREIVRVADENMKDDVAGTDAFQRLAELDPRDPEVREKLLTRLARHGRHRAIAELHGWEVANLETQPERKAALDALLALHAKHPVESTLVVRALRTYRGVEPGDASARLALVSYLRSAGDLPEAAQLLGEAVRAAPDNGVRLERLAELAELLEFGLRDDPSARTTALHTLELAPETASAVERLERIADRSQRRDLAIEALTHRARIAEGRARVDVLMRLAALHESPPTDADSAIRAYEAARELDAKNPDAPVALLRLYAATSRPRDAEQLLAALARETDQRETRIQYLRQRARLLHEVLGDSHGAAECFREIRTLREDEEALLSLLDYTRATGLNAELSVLLATRLGATTDVEESIDLGMERATLLLDQLDDPREAERELLVIRGLDPSYLPALVRLSGIYLADENGFRLAEVTAEHLALTTNPAQRAPLARRLFGLHERVVPDPERALAAARDWVHAAPFDLEALRALAERLDADANVDELVKTLDARADELVRRAPRAAEAERGAMQNEAIAALAESVRLSATKRDDWAHAEARLLRALELGHADRGHVDSLVALAKELDAHGGDDLLRAAAATALARKAPSVVRPTKEMLYLSAADLFGSSLADGKRAFEVLGGAIAECPDDPEILQSLVDYGTAGGFESELDAILSERFDAAVDADTARALLRERANLLYTLGRYDDAADQYQRLSGMDPTDERARTRHRECLSRAERYQDLLIALGQALRHSGYDDMPKRVALLRDVARTWDTRLDNRFEAIDAWKKVLLAAPQDPEASEALERLGAKASSAGEVASPKRSLPPKLESTPSLPPRPAAAPVAPPPPPPPARSTPSVPPPRAATPIPPAGMAPRRTPSIPPPRASKPPGAPSIPPPPPPSSNPRDPEG